MITTSETGPDRTGHVDCVVVGSGFGGSVAAYRFAAAGRSVVVLERGRPYPPGSFARTPAAMSRNFWDPSQGRHGLFDVWSFRGMEGVVSSGLGGGSLIYANVLLRKDERWFVHESPVPGGGYETWPVTRADLDPHYDNVERMLGATRYPYPGTPKTVALRESAGRLGMDHQLLPLAVTFAPNGADGAGQPVPGAPISEPDYGNLHGLPRQTCRLCGECDVGCNYGAKNTLDHTYLSAAGHHGAQLRTGCEVRGFAPVPGGYEVRYVEHLPEHEGVRTAQDKLPVRTITCDRLVLAAGTFGTSYLLLRNRAALPGLSSTLGTRFSGNGDLLGFVLRAGHGGRELEASRGPVITSAVRVADEADGHGATGRGHYVQDAGYPAIVDWLAETTQLRGSVRRVLRFAAHRALARLRGSGQSNISRQIATLLGPGMLSGTSLPLLAMGRDIPDGVMRLRRGNLDIDWTTTSSRHYIEGVRATMRALADDLGGAFHDNPLWWAKRVITVHPLGGAPIGRHQGEAVCDQHGEVFGFPGLYVLDGAAMPGPVGPNPSLTIAALADRACDEILSRPRPRRTRVPIELPTRRLVRRPTLSWARAVRAGAGSAAGPEGPSGVSFTEEMNGYVALGETDPVTGRDRGRSLGQPMMFRLTITVDDVDAFAADRERPARAEGFVDCDVFGGRLPVQRGWFHLFTVGAAPGEREMRYRLHLRDAGGNDLTLVGHKEVRDDPGLDLWSDTSTLYFRMLAGHTLPDGDEEATVLGAGVLTIRMADFVRQLATFRGTGPRPDRALATFGGLFLGELWTVYGSRPSGGVRHDIA